jgi:hypothetical protein
VPRIGRREICRRQRPRAVEDLIVHGDSVPQLSAQGASSIHVKIFCSCRRTFSIALVVHIGNREPVRLGHRVQQGTISINRVQHP